jgi:transcriptional regulator GlxA family with amidase domain
MAASDSPPVPTTVAFLVFDDVEELDFVGPWEVFGVAGRVFPGSFALQLVSPGPPRVRARYGLVMDSIPPIYSTPNPTIMVLPGGQGRLTLMHDARLLEHLRNAHTTGTVLASVCTGVFFLAVAGLLAGRSATTHWSALEELRRYTGVTVVRQRYVDEGSLLTAAGISAGIELALYLVGRILGRGAAQEVAHRMEYTVPESGR